MAEEVHQCVIYDSRGKNAKLIGVEYIISDRIYRTLPDAEKKYYHPHAYEITSGLLIAPELKPDDEDGLMGKLVNTWGKTWHTWPDPKAPLPMGDPLLMWSYTRDGMIPDELLEKRDREYKMSTASLRRRRSKIGPVPNIPPPRSLDEIGRQWTADGPDEPRKVE